MFALEKNLIPGGSVWDTNMAAFSLFGDTNMAAVMSWAYALLKQWLQN